MDQGPTVLTPGHFLVSRQLKSLPTHIPGGDKPIQTLRRWNLTRKLTSDLWKSWHKRYLQSLQSSTCWTSPTRDFQVGDVVLLKDTALLTHTWPMIVIVRVFPGKDGHVDLRIHRKIYRRSTDRLVLLVPVTENSHDQGEYVGDSKNPRQPLQPEAPTASESRSSKC